MEDTEIETGSFFGAKKLGDFQDGLDADLLVNDDMDRQKASTGLLGKRGQTGQTTPGKKKSKREIYREIIKKSKMEKFRRTEEREEQRRMVREMKDEFRGIADRLSFLNKVQMKQGLRAKAGEDSDDDDYNGFLMKVQNQGLRKPEREVRVKEAEPEAEDEETVREVEDSGESGEDEEDDTVGDYHKVKRVKYNQRLDQMEDFEVQEENKQVKKFGKAESKREEKLMKLLDELEDEESSESEEGGSGLANCRRFGRRRFGKCF